MNVVGSIGMIVLALVALLAGWLLGRVSGTGDLRSLLAGKEAELAGKTAELAAKNAEVLRLTSEVQDHKEDTIRLRKEKDGLTADQAKWKQSADGLGEQNIKQEEELRLLRGQVTVLQTEATQSSEQLKAAQQSLANDRILLAEARKELTDTFAVLAADALKNANQQFLDQANSQFDVKQQAIDTLLQPVKETLGKLNEQTQQLEVKREGAYAKLGQQLLQLGEDQTKLQQAATTLSSALRNTRTTGKWGEIVLRRVVELAGMTEHCDFTQQHTQDENRPDLIVHLPNGRKIIVDAKTTMSSFHDAADIADENLRQQKLKEHAKNIRAQAMGLAKRRYGKAFEDAIDLTVCFIPHDVYYYAALQVDPGLFEDAASVKVVFATPTTLIALLKAAAFGWQQDSLRREAKEILAQAQEVYKRLTTATGHFKNLRGSLDSSVENYDKLLGSLESRVFPAARRMKELGISGDTLPSIEPINRTAQQPQAQDWQVVDRSEPLALAASEETSEE
ncbi:MAG: DNA recombination protein RmuC [Acidobacteriaceae bacterium]